MILEPEYLTLTKEAEACVGGGGGVWRSPESGTSDHGEHRLRAADTDPGEWPLHRLNLFTLDFTSVSELDLSLN